jgi:hypothetical protein
MAEETFRAVKTVSTETAAGRHSSIRATAPEKRELQFLGEGHVSGGLQTPQPPG